MTENEMVRPLTYAAYQQFLAEDKLMGSHCPNCEETYLPPRAICPACHGTELAWKALSGKGKVAALTFVTIVNQQMAAEGYGRDNPNCAGVVELEEGVKITARVLGLDASMPDVAYIGKSVNVVFQHQGEDIEAKHYLAFKAN